MSTVKVRIKRLRENAVLPAYKSTGAAAMDLSFAGEEPMTIAAGERKLVPTGIAISVPENTVAVVSARSGLSYREGITAANGIGVIDSDYAWAENEGHIIVSLRNPSDHEVIIHRGERFCQGVLVPFGTAEEEEVSTERKGGFGSTGI